MATILVADDQSDIRGLLEITLQRRGHTVLLADSGTAALDVAQNTLPDLAILDVNMPGMEGTQVARELRANKATRNLPILLLTALGGEADTLAGFAAGADDYVTKPFNPRELAARVQALLARGSSGSAPSARPQGRLIAVAGPKGGCGRTTIAVNLALALLRSGRSERRTSQADVLLIDGHLRQGDLDIHLNLRSTVTIRDLVPYAGHIDVAALQQALVPHTSGLKSLLRPREAGEADLISVSMWQEVLRTATAIGELVVVDLGPDIDDERCLATLEAADVVLLVTTPEIGAVRNARQLLEIMPRLGLEPDRVLPVLNRAHPRADLSAKDVAAALGRATNLVILPDDGPNNVSRMNRGTPVVLSDPRSALARELDHLGALLVASGAAVR
jgi:CheY-like chemotaxis protein/MinD-like ATPase involved in chromosome partitioning or flagellar assembly